MNLGTQDDIINRAINKSAPLFADYKRTVIGQLKKHGEAVDFFKLFEERRWSKIRQFEDIVYESIVMGNLLGRLEIQSKHMSALGFSRWGIKKAIDFVKKLKIITAKGARALKSAAKKKAREIAGGAKEHVDNKIDKAMIREYIKGGRSTRRMILKLKEKWSSFGITRAKPHHIRTIFETATQTAYQHGRITEQLKISDTYPYWTYQTVGDSEVRPAHKAMHGKTYRYDNPIWNTWYPPNGFNCRCWVDEDERGRESAYPSDSPDEGFTGKPGEFFD